MFSLKVFFSLNQTHFWRLAGPYEVMLRTGEHLACPVLGRWQRRLWQAEASKQGNKKFATNAYLVQAVAIASMNSLATLSTHT